MPSGPLDLRENIGLSQSAISKITTLESLDLERPKAAAVGRGELDTGEVDAVAVELRRFFALHVIVLDQSRTEAIAPSEKVDLLWHRFILETEDYVEFSDEIFGSYLHHRTYEEPVSSTDVEGLLDQYFEFFSALIWGGAKARCCPRPCE
jgi:hypothetical protein